MIRDNFNNIIVTETSYRNIIQEQLLNIGIKEHLLILEEKKIGTAASIAIASSVIDPECIIVISPSDLYISNVYSYNSVITSALNIASKNDIIVSIVTQAKNNNPNYGYICVSAEQNDYLVINSFIEKPYNIEKHGNYHWNTGIFVCKARIYLSQLKKYAPKIFNKITKLLCNSCYNVDNNLCIISNDCSEISVDKSIMENAQGNAAVIANNLCWTDLGNWNSCYDFFLNNTEYAVLVYEGFKSIKVVMREVIKNKLILILFYNKAFCIRYNHFVTEEYVSKLWGGYRILYKSDNILIKHLVLNSKKSISLQKHLYRDEYWLVISGKGRVFINNMVYDCSKGDCFFIMANDFHKLENLDIQEKLYMIELQSGTMLSEDDIIRILD